MNIFYRIFFSSSPEIESLFISTDMAKQKSILKSSFPLIMAAYSNPIVLKNIATSHNRINLDIKPTMYKFWVNSLLEAVEIVDPKYSPEVNHAWREILSAGIEYMKSQYNVV